MHLHYRNLIFLLLSFLATYFFAQTYLYEALLTNLQTVSYVGIFIVGIFFVSVFTVAPAAVVLIGLGQVFSPATVAGIAGLGAVIGDYLIFRFIREGVLGELRELVGAQNVQRLVHPFQSRYFAWLLPLIGAIIIASPLPDEVGVTLMGISKIKQWMFVVVAYALNTVGIYLLIRAAT